MYLYTAANLYAFLFPQKFNRNFHLFLSVALRAAVSSEHRADTQRDTHTSNFIIIDIFYHYIIQLHFHSDRFNQMVTT